MLSLEPEAKYLPSLVKTKLLIVLDYPLKTASSLAWAMFQSLTVLSTEP